MAEQVLFSCECGQKLAAGLYRTGDPFRCPKCGRAGRIPADFDQFVDSLIDEPGDTAGRDFLAIGDEWDHERERQDLRKQAERAMARRQALIVTAIFGGCVVTAGMVWLLWDVLPVLIYAGVAVAIIGVPVLLIVSIFHAREFDGFRALGALGFVIGGLGAAGSGFAMNGPGFQTSVVLGGLGAILYVVAAGAAELQKIRRRLEDRDMEGEKDRRAVTGERRGG